MATVRHLVTIIAVLSLAGCAATHRTREATLTGFLGDYSKFQQGKRNEAQLIYVNPTVNFAAYDKVMIEPITIWQAPANSVLSRVTKRDLDQLTSQLYWAIRKELEVGGGYVMVQQPGPGVMRLRLAVTEVRHSRPLLDLTTTVLPPALVVSTARRLATGTHMFVGKAAIEAEMVDSLSGKRLLAAVDERAGRKTIRGKLDAWDDVQSAFNHWAKQLRIRLGELSSPAAGTSD